MEDTRLTVFNEDALKKKGRCVIYWMQASQRVHDNYAFNTAIRWANKLNVPLVVYFGLWENYPAANERAYLFMLEGLREVEAALAKQAVSFVLRVEDPTEGLPRLCNELDPCLVVSEDNSLSHARKMRQELARNLRVYFVLVDANTVIPQTEFPREEEAPHQFRARVERLLPDHLKGLPQLKVKKSAARWKIKSQSLIDYKKVLSDLSIDRSVAPSRDFKGGRLEGERLLSVFVRLKLPFYKDNRNDPSMDGTSDLSPYLHFGQLSARQVAAEVVRSMAEEAQKAVFLEELVVRREMAFNFVRYNLNYDNIKGCPLWAQESLHRHRDDWRGYSYTAEQFEKAQTHDRLWNASQLELIKRGKIHGFLRVVWAKRILEWSPDVREAFEIAINLNNKFALDGRGPSSFAGVARAIGGKHDAPVVTERKIFGLVRSINVDKLARRFNTEAYISRVEWL